jgi:DMSO/TMAO reductase YedYZ molybdopterin-dependent catalytic subunit
MSEKISKAAWRRKTRRDFLAAGAAGVLGVLGASWLFSREDEDGIPWPLRAAHRWNEAVWRKVYNNDRLGETPAAPAPGTPARVNGDLGLADYTPASEWRLSVSPLPDIEDAQDPRNLRLTLDRLRALPQTETAMLFKCIEGWSEVMSCKGVRFTDFMAALKLGTRDGQPPNAKRSNLYRYVGLETPNQRYYVSLDMESMLHPKTILATELNGAPLNYDHGAPLRLIVPVKYGIKSLKRVGRIFFADTRPPDYWAEQGYDWYASL